MYCLIDPREFGIISVGTFAEVTIAVDQWQCQNSIVMTLNAEHGSAFPTTLCRYIDYCQILEEEVPISDMHWHKIIGTTARHYTFKTGLSWHSCTMTTVCRLYETCYLFSRDTALNGKSDPIECVNQMTTELQANLGRKINNPKRRGKAADDSRIVSVMEEAERSKFNRELLR